MGRFHAPRRLAILASIAMVALLLAVPGVRAADTGTAQTYLVVFRAQALPSNAAASITARCPGVEGTRMARLMARSVTSHAARPTLAGARSQIERRGGVE